MKLTCYSPFNDDSSYMVRDEETGQRIAVDLTKEQAEEIVRAVNSNRELVDSLENLLSCCEDIPDEVWNTSVHAIKLAKGE